MSDDFKRKLEEYANGTLQEDEQLEVEAELEKMELYQEYLNQIMDDKKEANGTDLDEKKVVKRGKRRSRLSNVGFTIFVLFGIFFVGSILTSVYYQTGEPVRSERYREALKISVATTIPNVTVRGGGMNVTFPFGMDFSADLMRKVGGEETFIGELTGNFFFSSFNKTSDLPWETRVNAPGISSPSTEDNPEDWFICEEGMDCEVELEEAINWNEWMNSGAAFDQLDHLPDGTVAELFISFTDLMTTEEVLKLFEGREMELRWFAVETESDPQWSVFTTIGFPYDGYALWEDWIRTSTEEGAGLFGMTSIVMQSGHWEGFEAFGDADRREDEFLRALKIMQEYSNISREFIWESDLENAINHIEENGVRIPGVVVTGPTKELLNLQDEDWVRRAEIGEVALWNWFSNPDF